MGHTNNGRYTHTKHPLGLWYPVMEVLHTMQPNTWLAYLPPPPLWARNITALKHEGPSRQAKKPRNTTRSETGVIRCHSTLHQCPGGLGTGHHHREAIRRRHPNQPHGNYNPTDS